MLDVEAPHESRYAIAVGHSCVSVDNFCLRQMSPRMRTKSKLTDDRLVPAQQNSCVLWELAIQLGDEDLEGICMDYICSNFLEVRICRSLGGILAHLHSSSDL